MCESGAVLRQGKEVVKAAKRGEWDLVIRSLGCTLSMKTSEQEKEEASGGDIQSSWQKILNAVKLEFWGWNGRLVQNRASRLSLMPVHPFSLLDTGIFNSLSFSFGGTGASVTEAEESKIIKLVLAQREWPTLSVILFFFTDCCKKPKLALPIIKKAVEIQDVRFVRDIAVDCIKMQDYLPNDVLEIFGICDPMNREKRNSEIRKLIRAASAEWKEILLETVIKAMCALCRRSGVDIEKWRALITTMEDFDCETAENRACVMNVIDHLIVAKKCDVHPLVRLGLETSKHYVLEATSVDRSMTPEDASKALPLSVDAKHWYAVARYLKLGAEMPEYQGGEPLLFKLIEVNDFQLTPRHLGTLEIDFQHEGFTLLHRAVDHWKNDNTGFLIFNILFLMSRKADINMKDPKGLTVLQKLVDKTSDPLNSSDRDDKHKVSDEQQKAYQHQQADNHRLDLIVRGVNYAAKLDREIDWTPAPDSEWNALHVLCDEGDFDNISRLLELKADPFQHRQGLTLFDTVITAGKPTVKAKEKVFQVLLQVPDLIKDHVDTIKSRSSFLSNIHGRLYRFPLEYLLRLTCMDVSNFELVKILNGHLLFTELEFKAALEEPSVGALQASGLDDVMEWLEKQAEMSGVERQVKTMNIRA